ncbi:MAG TPA: 2-amino-3,7-dideoxy-D-threo-hept-6-ulosonate synthase [Methanomassiliicoccales archaeon]|nr:2-amino-3,7-dideoxy-D-threo-hept-6-ulosonate synthase [Methanomassiliicoccales archaeon]
MSSGALGKAVRMERIMDRGTGRAVIVPMDHGISMGPIEGLVDLRGTIDKVSQGGATAIVLHKGVVPYSHRAYGRDIGLILHLSASTNLAPDPNRKVLVTSVEEAIKIGADAVSVHVNLGADYEQEMLSDLGAMAESCAEWGMPLLVMIYPRGKDIKDSFDVDHIKQCARTATELGADIVKTNYTGDIDSFREVTRGALAPVVIAGGPKMDSDERILQMVKDSIEAGGKGVSIGRNVFQHRNIVGVTRAISGLVLHDLEVEEALKFLQ